MQSHGLTRNMSKIVSCHLSEWHSQLNKCPLNHFVYCIDKLTIISDETHGQIFNYIYFQFQ
jgi:hypothetical protein